jgi:hypothetical protein
VARKYHLASPQIKCVADRIGAHIFIFTDADGDDFRILAYDSSEACDLYLKEMYPDREGT